MSPAAKRAGTRAKAEERDGISQPEVGVGDPITTNEVDAAYDPDPVPPGDPISTNEVDALETDPPPEVLDPVTTHELEPLETEGEG